MREGIITKGALLLGVGLLLSGCERGEGGPCEVNSDCESGLICDDKTSPRGRCVVPSDDDDDTGDGDGNMSDSGAGDGGATDAGAVEDASGPDDEDAGA